MDVVIPTIGRPTLRDLLVALAGQARLPRTVVVVDDRPARDRRRPLVDGPVPAALAGRVVVVAGRAAGPAAARNTGWRRTSAPWVAFLDDDVLPSPHWADDLADDLAAAPGYVGAVQGRIRVPAGRGRRSDRERTVGRLEAARWITADLAVRRDALAAVGGFDERFPRAYREDADFCLRLVKARHEIVEGRRETTHRVHPAPWWISVAQQRGNADDALLIALHGPHWQGRRPVRGRRRRHLAITGAGALAAAAAVAGRRTGAAVAGALWLAGTAELAWARIAPGPRTLREVGAMAATSAVLPAAATYHWLTGRARARRLVGGPAPAVAEDPTLPPLPRSLQVEVTASCNLRCPMCLVAHRPPVGRHEGAMPLARYLALLDAVPGIADVTLQGLGEPLLQPDLVAMVRAAATRGAKVGFNTNATKLTPAIAAELIDAGVDWLAISMDGATAATYESIRRGARFDAVVANLEGLMAARRAAGGERPDVSLVFVAMRRNVAELPDVVSLAARLGIGAVSVQNLSHSFEDSAADPAYGEIRRYTASEALWSDADDAAAGGAIEATLAEARRRAEAAGVRLHLPGTAVRLGRRRADEPGCDWPWRAAYVTHDGVVQPCCMVMGSERAQLGTVDDTTSLAQVWWGDEARAFRAALLTDEPPSVCRGCSLYRGVF